MRLNVFFTIWINVILTAGISAQNLEQTVLYARQLEQEGQYGLAARAWERVIFFDSAHTCPYAWQALANANFHDKQYEKAEQYYDVAYSLAKTDSLRNEIIFRKTAIDLLLERYNYAEADLQALKDISSSDFMKRKEFYQGILCYFQKKYPESEKHILACMDSSCKPQILTIKKIYSEIGKETRHKHSMAEYLSIFPGLGQVYTGDLKDGLNSFLLTSAFAGLFVYTAYEYTVLEAVIEVLPWFRRYYAGGIKNVSKKIKEKKTEKMDCLYQQLIQVIASTK